MNSSLIWVPAVAWLEDALCKEFAELRKWNERSNREHFSAASRQTPAACQAECLKAFPPSNSVFHGGIHLVALFQSCFQFLVVQDRGNLQLHQGPPHISEFKKLLCVVCLQEVESAAETSSRPSSKELHPFRGQCTRFSESLNSFSTRLRIGAPIECQHEFHGCFALLLLYGRSSLPDNHNG